MNAADTKVMLISAKKTFLTDGIMKKIRATGMSPFYVHDAEQLGACADKEFGSIAYYMHDDGDANS